jgi:hypothetical protein
VDWANESYVRLYVRDTKTWMLLGWEGQCLLPLILRKLDRSGVLADVFGAEDLSVMLANGMPMESIEKGLSRLVTKEVVTFCDIGLLMTNYLVAQETPKTDKQRQKESRERRSISSRFVTVESRAVTNESQERSDLSQVVTDGHTPSQPVTLNLALPSSALPSLAIKEEIVFQNSEPTTKSQEQAQVKPTSVQRCEAAFRGGPGTRDDVVRLHAEWAKAVGRPGDKLKSTGDDAYTIADAIASYGVLDCLLVAKNASADGWVNGKLDKAGAKHVSIRYIFGNEETFSRILAAAKTAAAPKRRELTATELKQLGRG